MPVIALLLGLTPPAFAERTLDCARRLDGTETTAPHRRWPRAADRDPRVRLAHWRKYSPTLDRLDHFSAPALIGTVILDPLTHSVTFGALRRVAASAPILSRAVAGDRAVTPATLNLLDLIESRYRFAVELMSYAAEFKTGRRLTMTPPEYALGLLDQTRDVAAELGPRGLTELNSVDWNVVASRITSGLEAEPLFGFAISPSASPFRPEFLAALEPDLPLADLVRRTEDYLGRRLGEVPVGVSFRFAELTSTIRFGDDHFFGNWFMYTSTNRAAYLRGARRYGGVVDVELDVKPRQKKKLALLLDRSHRSLDPFFGAAKPRGCWLHSCGSYPPVTLLRAGIPLVTPAISAPGVAMVSLAAQRALGVPIVKSVRLAGGSKIGALKVAASLLHEIVVPAVFELELYVWLAKTLF